MKLRMLPISRVSGAAFWLCITVPIALIAARNLLTIAAVTVPLVVLGVVLSIRMFVAGVDCTDETIIIRGYFRSRRIPIGDVVGVDTRPVTRSLRGPALRWTDRHGRVRASRISAFGWARSTRANAHSTASLRRLSHWLGDRRTRLQPPPTAPHRRRKRRKQHDTRGGAPGAW